MMVVVTRFAPSPTGHLHLGHAHAALYAWHTAIAKGGRFLLRIEDIDRQRCRSHFEQDLLEDLEWLGLSWEKPVRRQSEHFADYRAALAHLQALSVTYPCFCSRRDIALAAGAPHEDDATGPVYPGHCRELPVAQATARQASGSPYAIRLNTNKASAMTGPLTWIDHSAGPQIARPERLGDVVLDRRDTPSSYHLSVTLDDALQGITLVTRGTDLFLSTHIHRLLQALLGLPTPDYDHHGLLTGDDGKRLSKRLGAPTLRALRASGHTPEHVRALAGGDTARALA